MRVRAKGGVFDAGAYDGHEQVVFVSERESGLRAIIAIHDTRRGPALGGCRMWPYAGESEALADALRLSRAMTYKAALAGLDLGGGKGVIIGDPARDRTPALIAAFARAVNRLGGRYITAEDVGISPGDLEAMRAETPHVRGIAEGGVGDPSPHTAHGVFRGLQASAAVALGRGELDGLTVAIQGLGSVGGALAGLLHGEGARLVVADIDETAVREAVERYGASAIAHEAVHAADADIFAPCALGGVLNRRTIPEIRARVVAGSANNQLEGDDDGGRLMARGILYAPDYAINAGGVIAISHEGPDFDPVMLEADVRRIALTLTRIFARAARQRRPTSAIADEIARERMMAERPLAPAACAGV